MTTENDLETESSSAIKPDQSKRKGLVMVWTGNGKGKTTAALGMAVRATGYNMRVLMIQFIKGDWKYGELKAAQRLSPQLEIVQGGKGFTIEGLYNGKISLEEHYQAAADSFERTKAVITSGLYDMVILDEIFWALKDNSVSLTELLDVIKAKPASLHLVLTGRGAPPEVVELADLVSEIQEIKHPYQQGIPAQKGVEF